MNLSFIKKCGSNLFIPAISLQYENVPEKIIMWFFKLMV